MPCSCTFLLQPRHMPEARRSYGMPVAFFDASALCSSSSPAGYPSEVQQILDDHCFSFWDCSTNRTRRNQSSVPCAKTQDCPNSRPQRPHKFCSLIVCPSLNFCLSLSCCLHVCLGLCRCHYLCLYLPLSLSWKVAHGGVCGCDSCCTEEKRPTACASSLCALAAVHFVWMVRFLSKIRTLDVVFRRSARNKTSACVQGCTRSMH